MLTRTFFLSNLAPEIDRVHSEVPADAPERPSILNGMRFLCAEDNALNAEILQAANLRGAGCSSVEDDAT